MNRKLRCGYGLRGGTLVQNGFGASSDLALSAGLQPSAGLAAPAASGEMVAGGRIRLAAAGSGAALALGNPACPELVAGMASKRARGKHRIPPARRAASLPWLMANPFLVGSQYFSLTERARPWAGTENQG